MRSKRLERERAIDLRRRGLSYSEIRKHVPVAKSSLSLWLRSVGLLEWQQERLSKRKLAAARMGGRKVHERRVERTKQTVEQAAGEGQQYLQAKDVHWLTGVVFYWVEGSKPKPWNHAEQFGFTNMDVTTIPNHARLVRAILCCQAHRHNLRSVHSRRSQCCWCSGVLAKEPGDRARSTSYLLQKEQSVTQAAECRQRVSWYHEDAS